MEKAPVSVPRVICFGEALWDVLGSSERPGGAPMNVAYHLHRLGLESILVSRLGEDQAGERLSGVLKGWGLDTTFCQQDSRYPTGRVIAEADARGDIHYEILYPVAWDFIAWEARLEEAVAGAAALVFGTLALRNEPSRRTLLSLLEKASYRVLDVNLRPPHYQEAHVVEWLGKADLVKLNEDELLVLSGWLGPAAQTEAERIGLLQKAAPRAEIILTRGARGASYFTAGRVFQVEAMPVKVADTIGSGDAFLAGFLARKGDASPSAQLSFAAWLAAFVTAHAGACPFYDLQMLETWRPFPPQTADTRK